MAKQTLDSDLVDMKLTEDILSAIQAAERRGTAGPTIFGSLQGIAVSVAHDEGAPLDEIKNVVDICWREARH